MYQLVCIIGESGSGKDTLLKRVLSTCKQKNLDVNKIVNCTTRPKREHEEEGIDYFYLTTDEFCDKILNGSMIEARQFNDWFYGTELSALKEDKINIGIFSPDAIYDLSENPQFKLWVYYIEASSKVRLLRQLHREDNPDVDEIIRRYNTDKIDFYDLQFYYNILPNNYNTDLETSSEILFVDMVTIEQQINSVNEN